MESDLKRNPKPPLNFNQQNWLDSPIFAAFMAGLYLSVFYVTNNLSMLSASSIVLVGVAFIAPITFVVTISTLLDKSKRKSLIGLFAVFVCTLYLIVALRTPVLDIDFIRSNFNLQGNSASTLAKLSYLMLATILATLFAFMFRQYIRIFTIALCVMTFTAFAPNFKILADVVFSKDKSAGYESDESTGKKPLRNKPNIYFILADGYGSFAYLQGKGMDVSGFKKQLIRDGFRTYDDVYSNYQPTTAAMSAMLNMEHHYYASALKFSEISKAGRVVIGGNNNLVHILRANDYKIEYIHQGAYLLLHGCSADYCFPDIRFAGAKTVLSQAIPGFLRTETPWETQSLDEVQKEVIRLIELETEADNPRFQYIHLYQPAHSSNEQIGDCNEIEQLSLYSSRVAEINIFLHSLIGAIISREPEATVVVAGDHGPLISGQCARSINLNQVNDYRDRAGVMMAIRWPLDYNGIYDDQIKTTINVFKYILASLAEDADEILDTVVADDVYIQGGEEILKIVSGGNTLIPPEHFAVEAFGVKQ